MNGLLSKRRTLLMSNVNWEIIHENILTMNKDELRRLQDLLNRRWQAVDTALAAKIAATIVPGDRVRFKTKPGTQHARQYGPYVYGIFEKMAIKNAKIKSDSGGRWTVAASLIEKVEDENEGKPCLD